MTMRRTTQRSDSSGSESGVVAVYAALLLPVFIILAAIAVDFTQWYVEQQRLQRAADAAALAGAVYMPDDFAKAEEEAEKVLLANGVDPSDANIVPGGEALAGLRVTTFGSVDNAFANFIDEVFDRTDLSRTAVGQFTGPAPMGSPCNTLGFEPPATSGPVSVRPTAPFGTCPGGSRAPGKFWATVLGPEQSKEQGDRFMTRRCVDGRADLCTGTVTAYPNDDFEGRGYYSIVGIAEDVVGEQVTVEIYDPAWINNGGDCARLPAPGDISDRMNPYAPDAEDRYERGRTQYCPGDQDANAGGDGNGGAGRVDTSFALLAPNPALDPTRSAPVRGSDGLLCIKQFRGYSGGSTDAGALDLSQESSYNRDLAFVLHQWVNLCTFTPTVAGDYYLQFRTNVPLDGQPFLAPLDPDDPSSLPVANPNGDPGIYVGNTEVYLQEGDNSSQLGRGNNNFAFRAYTGTGASQTAGDITISGYQRYPIFQNEDDPPADGAPIRFDLIRVVPEAKGQNIRFSFFDVAEGSSTGSFVRVLPPVDVTGSLASESTARDCEAFGPVGGTAGVTDADCQIPISSAANNGRLQELVVPVPLDYGCTRTSEGGCWWALEVSFGPGQAINDTTTWTAVLDGDPVRLEE